MPWHDCLMPVAPNYLAVERSIAECAYAGCDSIWVVCDEETTPLIRYQIGEKIQDPVYAYRHFEKRKSEVQKPIRIYYIPLAIKDINKKDNLVWSAIHGCQVAEKVTSNMSFHLAPKKFYISWPYGFYKPSVVREHRKTILDKHFLLTFKDKSAKDNLYLSLTLEPNQVNKLATESYTRSSGLMDQETSKRIPVEDRYSYRNFSMQEVFANLDIDHYARADVDEYHSLDCWSNYCEFISNYKQTVFKKPSFLKYSEWNEIGIDD